VFGGNIKLIAVNEIFKLSVNVYYISGARLLKHEIKLIIIRNSGTRISLDAALSLHNITSSTTLNEGSEIWL
jgi:hypothetical protein